MNEYFKVGIRKDTGAVWAGGFWLVWAVAMFFWSEGWSRLVIVIVALAMAWLYYTGLKRSGRGYLLRESMANKGWSFGDIPPLGIIVSYEIDHWMSDYSKTITEVDERYGKY